MMIPIRLLRKSKKLRRTLRQKNPKARPRRKRKKRFHSKIER